MYKHERKGGLGGNNDGKRVGCAPWRLELVPALLAGVDPQGQDGGVTPGGRSRWLSRPLASGPDVVGGWSWGHGPREDQDHPFDDAIGGREAIGGEGQDALDVDLVEGGLSVNGERAVP